MATRLDQLVYSPNCYIQILRHNFPRVGIEPTPFQIEVQRATDYAIELFTLIRIHTGHNRLNSHMHRRMNLVPSPLCTCETEDQTTEHILQRCPSYQHLRDQIWSHGTSLHQKLYGGEEELERTVVFIQQTGFSVYQAKEKRRKKKNEKDVDSY